MKVVVSKPLTSGQHVAMERVLSLIVGYEVKARFNSIEASGEARSIGFETGPTAMGYVKAHVRWDGPAGVRREQWLTLYQFERLMEARLSDA